MNDFNQDDGYTGYQQQASEERYSSEGGKLTPKKEPSQWIIDIEYILGKLSEKFANVHWILSIIIGVACNIGAWYTILLLPQIFALLAILVGFGVGTFLFLLGIIKLDMDRRWGLKWLMITIAILSNAIVIFTYLPGFGFILLGLLLLIMAFVTIICTLFYMISEHGN